MQRRSILIISCLVVGVLSACISQAAERPSPPQGAAGRGVLLVQTRDGVAAADISSGVGLFSERGAIASPDRTRIYSTADGDLRVIDAESGDVLASFPAPPGTGPVAASEDGLVALMTDGEATYPSTPEGRPSTPLDIEASDTGATQHLDLHGNFEPDAFSIDSRSLFLIQYLPAAAPDHYRVMELDLASLRIARVASPDKVPPSSMQGTRLQQVWAPDRSVLYTLYTNQVSSGAPVTFVHVLNLEDKWAHCIDLPAAFGASRPNAKAMVGSPNGTRLYVTDADAHRIATIDTRRFEVVTTTTASLPAPGAANPASASLSPDGTLLVSGGNEVAAFDTGSMTAGPAWASELPIEDLQLNVDGSILYAATTDQIEALDPRTGTLRGIIPLPRARSLLAVSGA